MVLNGIDKIQAAAERAVNDMLAAAERAAKDQEPQLRWLATQLAEGAEVRLTREPLTGVLGVCVIFRPAEGEEVALHGRGYNLGAAITQAMEAVGEILRQRGRNPS